MPLARGGVSFGAVLTGVVVAFGTLTLLLALAGGILAATDTIDEVSNVPVRMLSQPAPQPVSCS